MRETVRKRAEEERTRAAGEKAAKRKAPKEQEQRAHDAPKALTSSQSGKRAISKATKASRLERVL